MTIFLDYIIEIDGISHLYGQKIDTAAAEAWYLHEYMREICLWRGIAAQPPADLSGLPRKEKYFLLHGLICATSARRVTELGSSLLEIIDGLDAMRILLGPHGRTDNEYIGIEHSAFLAEVSRLLHPGRTVSLLPAATDIASAFPQRCGGVVYDRITSSSAFRDTASLADFLASFDAGILNLLTSRGETFTAHFLGNEYTYFSLAELQAQLCLPLYHLFGFRAPKHAELRATGRPVVEGFFFYGAPETLEAFLATCDRLPAVRDFMTEKGLKATPVADLPLLEAG